MCRLTTKETKLLILVYWERLLRSGASALSLPEREFSFQDLAQAKAAVKAAATRGASGAAAAAL